MNRYRVDIEGENAWIDLDDELNAVGFYVTRFVEAPDAVGAQRKALELVGDDLKSKVVSGTELGVRLTITACVLLDPSEQVPAVPPGFLWYPADDNIQH